MKKINILYIGRNEGILKTMLRLLNSNEHWNGLGVQTVEEALQICSANELDLVLLGNGIDQEKDTYFRQQIEETYPHAVVIQHYGGGSGLLKSEIEGALSQWQTNNP